MKKKVSVVIPAYNEAENIPHVLEDATSALNRLGVDYEVIVVDDGSTDGTAEAVKKYSAREGKVEIIRFAENRDKSAALEAGFRQARGDVVFMMDGDGQFTADDIPKFLAKMEEGFDVVNGWGVKKESASKRVFSWIFNSVCRLLWNLPVRQFNLGFKCFKREAVLNLTLKLGEHRFILPMLKEKGYKIGEVEIRYYPRKYGKTKYGSIRLLFGVVDMIGLKLGFMLKDKPMRFFGTLGVFMFLIGSALIGYAIYLKLLGDLWSDHVPLMFSITLSLFIGIQFFSFGFLAENLTSVRREVESIREKIT